MKTLLFALLLLSTQAKAELLDYYEYYYQNGSSYEPEQYFSPYYHVEKTSDNSFLLKWDGEKDFKAIYCPLCLMSVNSRQTNLVWDGKTDLPILETGENLHLLIGKRGFQTVPEPSVLALLFIGFYVMMRRYKITSQSDNI
jgi:hypothetical protein